jgi:D-beta-D-heptose 7-phosphate kinase/D-beta-D-heptose 1-phosphate adenosyltransferase
VVNLQSREDVPGGAANAALNLALMGAQVSYLTVTGKDHEGQIVSHLLKQAKVDTESIFYDASRQTLTKKRVLSGDQLIVRYDYGTTNLLSPTVESHLIERLKKLYSNADAILISDYGYGICTDRLIDTLKTLQQSDKKPLIVDSKHLTRYHELRPTAVKPNYGEAVGLLQLTEEKNDTRVDQILSHHQRILEITGSQIVALTLDREGAVIFERDRAPYRTHAKATPDSQAAGAGDTYVSALTLALSSGCETITAAEIAAAAANIVVRKKGTATCSQDELTQFFTPSSKVIANREELSHQVTTYRDLGKRIIFTNGCFDNLHRSHITYLSQAKSLGDVLIVGVNNDESLRCVKGTAPTTALEDRMHVLAALDCVDHVVQFGEQTADELIKVVKPDVFVKGGNYRKASLPEAKLVESFGGHVEILPYLIEVVGD